MNKIIEIINVPQYTVNKKEKLVQDRGQTITLFADFLLLRSRGLWNVENEDTGLIDKDVEYNNVTTITKTVLNRIDVFRHADSGLFVLDMNGWPVAFPSKIKCEEIFNRLIQWRYDVDLTQLSSGN